MKRFILTITAMLMMGGVCWAGIDNPIGNWPLTSRWMNGPTTVLDLGSGGNDGTVVDAVVGTDSTTFNGTSAYIDCGNVFDSSATFSVSVWYKSVGGTILSKGEYAGELVDGFYISKPSAVAAVRVYGDDGDSLNYLSETIATDSTDWVHFCVTYNGTTVVIYSNGVPNGNRALTIADTALPLLIGNRSTSNYYFTGQMSDVRIYDRALTPSDVAELWEKGRSALSNSTISGMSLNGVSIP